MKKESCFVIMSIGTQMYGDFKITADELKMKYDDLIKEAILKACPNLEVSRADEFPMPGTITTDIITRLMYSKYVVADVTYPNANVFYELGLRHASSPGTIIIKDKAGPAVPFDIAHLRYIEYENTPSGLKDLSDKIKQYIGAMEKNPGHADNHFLEMAKLLKFEYPQYTQEDKVPLETQLFMGLMQSPEILEMMMKQQSGEELDQMEIMKVIMSNPDIAVPMLNSMVSSGELSLTSKQPNRAERRSSKKK